MSTTDSGKRAERAVAEFLQRKGYEILEHNWRTKLCEIDVIAKKAETIFLLK